MSASAEMEMSENDRRKQNQKSRSFKIATRELVKELNEGTALALPTHQEKDEEKHEEIHPATEVSPDGLQVPESLFGAAVALAAIEALIIILYATVTEVRMLDEPNPAVPNNTFLNYYNMYMGIAIMMFFGFGYLMTFLKRYGMGAVGFTAMITIIGLQWGILTEAFFRQAYHDDWHFVHIDIFAIIDGMFQVAAILISYGAIIGKVNPLQLVVLTFLECIFYSINKSLLLFGVVDLVDAGGTINIHMFGAYFGLAVAFVLGKPKHTTDVEGGHVADLFSLVGTTFLWLYWPSFNGGFLEPNSHQQQRAIINSILGLCASSVGAFFTSSLMSGHFKFRPVDIQNATLAGGVGMGAICHLTMRASDPLLVGLACGGASVFGFARLQAMLDHLGVHDTCGVHNLHGIPSLIGGAASIIIMGYKGPMRHDMPNPIVHETQWEDQFISVAFTLAVAISSGIVTGFILYALRSDEHTTEFFTDAPYWEVMDDFGRSVESDTEKINQGLKDLEVGIKASNILTKIIMKYNQMGLSDMTTHSHLSNISGHEHETRKQASLKALEGLEADDV